MWRRENNRKKGRKITKKIEGREELKDTPRVRFLFFLSPFAHFFFHLVARFLCSKPSFSQIIVPVRGVGEKEDQGNSEVYT